ncbi:uncharacterized protein VTP21DRAFT_3998 [Calcarisporiella thermophila]|uniref:uncharacterized protein n=1 Tax=Calcarisporiella thermophila TaxID=911321 RepID=UPI0037428A2F
MCCGGGSKWKREEIQDHKFDYVDIDEFHEPHCGKKVKYMFVFLVIIKCILVYCADLWTAVTLLVYNKFSVNPSIPFEISKWIYVGCIILSFLLLLLDIRKAKAIIESRDIAYAFTSIIAYRYYALRSYPHYCFFTQINNQRKRVDEIAFYVFFTLKGWKRLMLAEGPRQIISAVTLWSIIKANIYQRKHSLLSWDTLGESMVQRLSVATMAFTLIVWLVSMVSVLLAFFLYIPLLFHIRGNLKEYCCHKIDKRIAELLRKKSRKRIEREQRMREAEMSGSQNGDKKGGIYVLEKQPTLPNIDLYDEELQRPLSAAYTLGPGNEYNCGRITPALSDFNGHAGYPHPHYARPNRRGSNSTVLSGTTAYTNVSSRSLRQPQQPYMHPYPSKTSLHSYNVKQPQTPTEAEDANPMDLYGGIECGPDVDTAGDGGSMRSAERGRSTSCTSDGSTTHFIASQPSATYPQNLQHQPHPPYPSHYTRPPPAPPAQLRANYYPPNPGYY